MTDDQITRRGFLAKAYTYAAAVAVLGAVATNANEPGRTKTKAQPESTKPHQSWGRSFVASMREQARRQNILMRELNDRGVIYGYSEAQLQAATGRLRQQTAELRGIYARNSGAD